MRKHPKTGILAAVCALLICGCQAKNTAAETTAPADTNAAAAETTAADTAAADTTAAETTAAETEKTEAPAPAKPAEKVDFPSEISDETAEEILTAAISNTVISINSAFAPDSLTAADDESKTFRIDLTNRDLVISGEISANDTAADMALSLSDKGTSGKASFGVFSDMEEAVFYLLTPDDSYRYGVNYATAEEDIKNSVFAPGSGSELALPEDFDFSVFAPNTERYEAMTEMFTDIPLTVSEEGDSIIITCAAEGDEAYELIFGMQGQEDYSAYKDYYTEINGGVTPDAAVTAEFTADKTSEELVFAKINTTIKGDSQVFGDAGGEISFGTGEINVKLFENEAEAGNISVVCDKSDGYSLEITADTISDYTGESEKTVISLNSKDGKFSLTSNSAGDENLKMTGTVTNENGTVSVKSDSFTIAGESPDFSIDITISDCDNLTRPESKPFFSITEEELEAMSENIGNSLNKIFEDSDSAIGDYIRKANETALNMNAKQVYQSAATYTTKCEINGASVTFGAVGGEFKASEGEPVYDGTKEDFIKAMNYLNDGYLDGYFYVIIEDNCPTKTMWSEEQAFADAISSGKTEIDFDESLKIGVYPQ